MVVRWFGKPPLWLSNCISKICNFNNCCFQHVCNQGNHSATMVADHYVVATICLFFFMYPVGVVGLCPSHLPIPEHLYSGHYNCISKRSLPMIYSSRWLLLSVGCKLASLWSLCAISSFKPVLVGCLILVCNQSIDSRVRGIGNSINMYLCYSI